MELMYLNFQYFFDAYPPVIKSGTFWLMLNLSTIAIIIAFLIKYLIFWKKVGLFGRFDKYKKELFLKFYNISIWFAVINLFLLFFRKTRVPYFQTRFLMIVWFVFIFVWLCSVLQHYLTKVPVKRLEDAKRREYEKYIK